MRDYSLPLKSSTACICVWHDLTEPVLLDPDCLVHGDER